MKKIGSISDFTTTRDRELYRNFLDLLRNARDVSLKEMYGLAAARPATRFWVSERRAAEVVSDIISGRRTDRLDRMYPLKRQMYLEIAARVRTLMEAEPALCVSHAVERVVNDEAPEFYLTPESAKVIIYRHRRRLKAEKLEIEKRNANLRKALGKLIR